MSVNSAINEHLIIMNMTKHRHYWSSKAPSCRADELNWRAFACCLEQAHLFAMLCKLIWYLDKIWTHHWVCCLCQCCANFVDQLAHMGISPYVSEFVGSIVESCPLSTLSFAMLCMLCWSPCSDRETHFVQRIWKLLIIKYVICVDVAQTLLINLPIWNPTCPSEPMDGSIFESWPSSTLSLTMFCTHCWLPWS